MTSNIKTLVTVLLDSDVGNELQREFFNSDMPELTKYTVEGDNEDTFLKTAADMGVVFEHIDNHGGEGEGEQYWAVYKFSKGDESVMVKFDGSYQSYDGSTFDSWFFVEGRQVQITQFFKI